MEIIETKRLILRPFRETDYDDLYEFLAQQRDAEFEAYPGLTCEGCKKHLARRLGSADFLALELKQTGKVIGNLYCADREHQAKEVGYIVNEKYRRQGYALKALRAFTDRAFRTGVHRIYAECDPRNEASRGLLEKAGFRQEALFRQYISFRKDQAGNPVWSDTCVYAMLESDQERN